MTTPGPVRLDALHGQPRLLDGRAVPHRRLPDQPPRLPRWSATSAACSGSRRCWPAPSWSPACPASRCPACRASSASSWCWSARTRATRSRRSSRPLGIVLAVALHPADVPADDDRAGARRAHGQAAPTSTSARRCVVAPLIAVIIALGFFPKPLLDVINPAVDAHHAAGRRHRPRARRAAAAEARSRVSRSTVAADGRALETPSIEYHDLLPILIVLGVAVLGVLVEAFMGRAVAARDPAGARDRRPGRGVHRRRVAGRRLRAASPPRARWPSTARRCSCRAPSCCWRSPALLVTAERSLDPAGRFAPAGSAMPGSRARAAAHGHRRRPRPRSSRC